MTIRLANGQEKDITNDEIERFVDARYISASEASWRLYEFPIQQMQPSVQKLPVHLDNEQTVLFQPGEVNTLLSNGPPQTKLTEFFKLNRNSELNITYPNVFKYFTWSGNTWKRRAHVTRLNRDEESEMNDHQKVYSDTIGRIPVINLSSKQSELFYLRMLLHIVARPTSYEDLRTHNGVVYPTYQLACLALGLLDDDSEVDKAMEEAASVRFGSTLREVFANILIFVRPSNPNEFWNKHKLLLMEDLLHKYGVNEPTEPMIHTTLLMMQMILVRHRLDIEKDLHIQQPDPVITEQLEPVQVVSEETNYDVQEQNDYVSANMPLLNNEQRIIFSAVMDSVDSNQGQLFSVDAPGGTGKTFLLTLLLARVRSEGKVALATAMSGIAATLLPNGRTLHSRCKVPLSIKENSVCSITKRDSTGILIQKCHLLVIDEVSMCDRRIIEAADRTFRDVRGVDKPFGGITIIFSGDWRQILPVIRRGGRAHTIRATIKQSVLWKHVHVYHLTVNMRVLNAGFDNEFANTLLQIGEGRLPILSHVGEFKVQIEEKYFLQNIKSLIDFIFDDLAHRYRDPTWLCSRTILCPTNDAVTEINTIILREFPGEEKIYLSLCISNAAS